MDPSPEHNPQGLNSVGQLTSCSSPSLSRRRFLKLLGGTSVVFPNIFVPKAVAGTPQVAANSRITVGAIGVGGMGRNDLGNFLQDSRAQVVAVCDVVYERATDAKQSVDKHYGNSDCRSYTDYREMLVRNDIDAILCATPDHWHAQISIDAMRSGKDVYCEKPLSLTIDEGKKMVATARQFGRVFSCGSQRVIGDYGLLACAARSGRFGKILMGRTLPGGPSQPCYLPGEPMPPGLMDWDLWLGPAPWAPYHPARCGGMGGPMGGFRSWYDYSGGIMTDWGGHKFGALMHGMGLDHTGPTEILSPEGDRPMTFVFANGMKIEYAKSDSVEYHCEAGLATPLPGEPVPPGLRWYENGAKHPINDFLTCVGNRKRPFQDVEYAHRTATLCHLGNICLALNRPLKWDPEKEDFVNDPEASRHLSRARRGPWQI